MAKGNAKSRMENACDLCGRVTKRGTTEHHLIPRRCHSNKWFKKNFTREEMLVTVPLCIDCHRAVHQFVPSEKVLGREYHSLDKLLDHDQIAAFVEWVSKQK